jgi:enoyl reductase
MSRRRISTLIALPVSILLLGLGAGPAQAKKGPPPQPPPPPAPAPPAGAGTDSGDISVWVKFDETHNYQGTDGAGQKVSVSADWVPPLCWWEPKYTPQQFSDYMTPWAKPGTYEYTVYHDGQPYTDFNIGQNGEWWQTFENYTSNTFWKAVDDCGVSLLGTANPPNQPWTWAAAGQVPPGGGTLNGRDLGQLALQHMQVPPIRPANVGLAPVAGNQVVNLASWLWLNQNIFHPIWVTASLKAPMPPLQATATATPATLDIDPGDPNAQVFTSGCAADKAGHIGQQWTAQAGDPTCGVLYRDPGPHTITLKLVWNVTWTSNDPAYPGGTVPGPVTSQGTVPVVVGEIQTIN